MAPAGVELELRFFKLNPDIEYDLDFKMAKDVSILRKRTALLEVVFNLVESCKSVDWVRPEPQNKAQNRQTPEIDLKL